MAKPADCRHKYGRLKIPPGVFLRQKWAFLRLAARVALRRLVRNMRIVHSVWQSETQIKGWSDAENRSILPLQKTGEVAQLWSGAVLACAQNPVYPQTFRKPSTLPHCRYRRENKNRRLHCRQRFRIRTYFSLADSDAVSAQTELQRFIF
jgi:hypothetical protein